jgi:secreted trypsin-like serine protease
VSVAGHRWRCCSYFACSALLIGAVMGVAAPGSYYATASALAKRSPRAVQSIVGGAGASIASFPFQVALYDPAAGSPAEGFFCGGVIVDATHVITAAHCLAGGGHGRGSVAREVEVLAGSTRLDQPDSGSVRDPVATVSVDPSYNPSTNDYDIGVVTLARPLWSGSTPSMNGADTIAPLPIDIAGAEGYGEPSSTQPVMATVSGWGDMSPAPSGSPSYPSALRSVGVPLVPEALCAEEYASIEQTITPRMICAGSSSPREDSCYGDSGGPLVVDRDTPARPPGDYVLVGLVDFGNGCAQPGFAGVYTRIADPAIARFLASDVGHRARAAARRPGRKRKRHRMRR